MTVKKNHVHTILQCFNFRKIFRLKKNTFPAVLNYTTKQIGKKGWKICCTMKSNPIIGGVFGG